MKEIKLEEIKCNINRDAGDITTLAASIRELGLLQPIILKGDDDSGYEVVDGRRRFNALKSIGKKELTPDEYTLYSGESTKAAFVANIERKQLTPSEEVRQLNELHKNFMISEIAQMLGRSKQYVAMRINLSTLIDEFQNVLDHMEDFPCWTMKMLELVARQPHDVQEKLSNMLDWSSIDLKILESNIKSYNMELSAACFCTDECKTCHFRSGYDSLLFYEDESQYCMNRECFCRKTIEELKKKIKEDKSLIPIQGTGEHTSYENEFSEKTKALYPFQVHNIREPKKGERPTAVYISGDQIGRFVCCDPLQHDEPVRKADIPKKEPTAEELQKELELKRNREALKILMETLEQWRYEDFVSHVGEARISEVMNAFLYLFGMYSEESVTYRFPESNMDKLENPEICNMTVRILEHGIAVIVLRLRGEIGYSLDCISQKIGPRLCKYFGLDWNDFMTSAMIAIPEPKKAKAKKK